METVLITGCSSGIGLRSAERLRDAGYRVLASARQSADVERLQQLGFEAHPLDLDCSDSIAQAVAWVVERCDGQLDAVFHNGAYGQPGALEDLSREALRQQFETNLFGWHELTCAVIPLMRARGRGRIVLNSSVLGLVCMPYRGAYNASKFALEAMADTLRMELNGSGIEIVLIEPGPIDSRFRENARRAFLRYIDPQRSHHAQAYAEMDARLTKPGLSGRFTLPADAVADKLLAALQARRPKTRYYVTTPTYLFAFLKRVLPTTLLDRILSRG
ncbi:SDR family NAD(P)-dependent oxidoreductase [Motiliproteus coralliicola]|uniref:SDR family NAD(P)-dependent oxidoreductase n=1 Tax=Motiliproteus coralliicola TaxID=2283196 RepID=UPI001A9DC3CD|nr:SDR family NAD(P)-dependent oxidoreductase [Motiliproteus coralliicola]